MALKRYSSGMHTEDLDIPGAMADPLFLRCYTKLDGMVGPIANHFPGISALRLQFHAEDAEFPWQVLPVTSAAPGAGTAMWDTCQNLHARARALGPTEDWSAIKHTDGQYRVAFKSLFHLDTVIDDMEKDNVRAPEPRSWRPGG